VWSLVCVWSAAWAWQVTLNGTADRAELATGVTVDAAGDVVADGWTDNRGSLNDFTVVKVAGASGAEVWRAVIVGTAQRFDVAQAVTVDAAGDVLVAGMTSNAGTGGDFTVVKFSGSSGAERWRAVIDGTGTSNDEARAVTVDAAGDAVAAGWTENRGSGLDVTVAKVAGASGAEVWRMALDGAAHRDDQAFAVSVDGVGDVLTAGVTSQSDTGGDFTVVKVAGANGAEVWRASLDGTGAGTDQANAVTVDGKGDVLAAGWTSPTSPRLLPRMEASFTVVKRRGTDGGDF
jgi:hypothetical protein